MSAPRTLRITRHYCEDPAAVAAALAHAIESLHRAGQDARPVEATTPEPRQETTR